MNQYHAKQGYFGVGHLYKNNQWVADLPSYWKALCVAIDLNR